VEKINYIIPTWSGERRIPNQKYLREHLLKLLSLKHNLSQITIVKPMIGVDNVYYDVEGLISQFDCEVVILERHSNVGQSYGQFFYAYEKFKNDFDYYIFVEDDYVPSIDNFDSILLNEYKSQGVKGYLCSFSGVNKKYPNGGCSVSNGIISKDYMKKIYDYSPSPIKSVDGKAGDMCHVKFTDLLIESGLVFKDFTNKYRVPYFAVNVIEYGRTDVNDSVFVPNQMLDLNLSFSEMTLKDIPFFLEIRNNSKEFLHNNSEFTIVEAQEWFKESRPKFFIIKLGCKKIGYFRTSNWDLDNKTMYLGCDVHPDFRGHSLGFKSYVEFIKDLNKCYDLNNIKLEVLSNNVRAINLYNKLGFKNIGVSQKIKRDNIEIDSIIMKLDLK